MKNKIDVVNIAPSWRGMARTMVLLIQEGTTAEARKTGYDELDRMAQLADQRNEMAELLADIVKMNPRMFKLMKTKAARLLAASMKEAR